ncbi:MAG TPA: aminoglycoside phosphotransferase family protein [Candidatus Limnocylindrales bacterium]|nr:aminoglycoside phosphotransferase family protein [Candidatus Limnocylindrales bacterium]
MTGDGTAFGSLADLLARHGLAGVPEEPFPNDGWSGASMTLLRRGAKRYVLKRDSPARDWIARSTRDGPILREAWFAVHGPPLPAPLRAPYLGAGIDGDDVGILMPDLSSTLLAWDEPIATEALDRVLAALAALHRTNGDDRLPEGPRCPLPERLTLICRASLERPGPARDAVGERILPGWDAFDRLAPPSVRRLVTDLGNDPTPLVEALRRQPSTLIHGDLKLANVGLADDGSVDLVDWQMVSVAPVAVELGWFLVANVASLPVPPDAVLARYESLAGPIGRDGADATTLVGLLLRGWRKGYDAAAGVRFPSGVTAVDDLAWWCDRALAAADRIL